MSVVEGGTIRADEVLEALRTGAKKEAFNKSITSQWGDDTEGDFYFWIRSNPDIFSYALWVAGSYDKSNRAWLDGKVWRSTIDANVSEPGVNATWEEMYETTVETYDWTNVTLIAQTSSSGATLVVLSLYKITWDINEDEVETLVYGLGPIGGGTDTSWSSGVEPGYYKVHYIIGASGSIFTKGTARGIIKTAAGDNTFLADDSLRVFLDNRSGLKDRFTTLLTATGALKGDYGSSNYQGGNHPAWTGD